MSNPITPNQMYLMIIGNFHPKYNAEGLAQGFEKLGVHVIRVAADSARPTPELSGKFDLHCIEHFIDALPYKVPPDKSDRTKQFYTTTAQKDWVLDLQCFNAKCFVKWYVKEFPQTTHILIIHNNLYFDISGVDVPVYYYYTAHIHPRLPQGKPLTGLFYAFLGGSRRIQNSWNYDFSHYLFDTFVPHGVSLTNVPEELLIPFEERDIKIGFKGLLGFTPYQYDDEERFVYYDRTHYIQLLREMYNPWDFIFIEDTHTNWDDYVEFMSSCKIAINVPSSVGFFNVRMFEGWAFGCCLLQMYFRGIQEFGFKMYYFNRPDTDPLNQSANCVLFETDENLQQALAFLLAHPEVQARIARNGHETWKSTDQTWSARAKKMFDQIIAIPESDVKHYGDHMNAERAIYRQIDMRYIK